jgi:hypothetical protein
MAFEVLFVRFVTLSELLEQVAQFHIRSSDVLAVEALVVITVGDRIEPF